MSALDDLKNKPELEQTVIERIILHDHYEDVFYPEMCEDAATELASLLRERDEWKRRAEVAEETLAELRSKTRLALDSVSRSVTDNST